VEWLRRAIAQRIDEVEARSLAPPTVDPHLPLTTGPPMMDVTSSSALRVADAFACVKVLSDAVASLPLHAFRRTAEGRVPAGPDARISQLLARPAPGSTIADLTSLERTVERAFAAAAAGPGVDAAWIGRWIGEQWRLDGPPIVRGWCKGHGEAAIVYLQRADGAVLRFARLGDLFDPAAHVRRVSIVARTVCPTLTKAQAVSIAQQVIALCDVRDDPEGDVLELQGWLEQFVGHLGLIVPGELLEPGEGRWQALLAVADFRAEAREPAPRTCAVRDGRGRLWLPAEALLRHVRYFEGARIGWGELHSRLLGCGWERRVVEQWQPGVGRDGRRIRRVFYVEKGAA
jgi:hypothetical protein